MSAIGSGINKFIWTALWPWFLKYVWPVIQKHLLELIGKALKSYFERAWSAFNSSSEAKTASAGERASEAEAQAEAATTEAEREKHLAIAKVWREVAEQFRTENESLKRQLADALAVEQAAAEQETATLLPTLTGDSTESAIVINGERLALPALPESASS